MKRLSIVVLLVLTVFLAGCLSPKVNFTILPNPLEVEQGQESIEVILNIKLSGFSFGYELKDAIFSIVEEIEGEDPKIWIEETFAINQTIPVVAGIGHTLDPQIVSLSAISDLYDPLVYDETLKGKEFILQLIVTGTKTSEAEAKIIFK